MEKFLQMLVICFIFITPIVIYICTKCICPYLRLDRIEEKDQFVVINPDKSLDIGTRYDHYIYYRFSFDPYIV